jgi:hypothetical protein
MAGGAHLNSGGNLHKESGGDSHHRSFAIKDDSMESRIPVRIERSRSLERRGGAGEPAQVASRSELSTPFVTKLEKPETGGAGAEREPFPPSTENNGTRFSNRRARRGSQQVHSRASKRDETNMSLAHLIGGEPGNLGGLMELFFPPLNPMQPNNRKLPGENDRWGFGGGSRSGQLGRESDCVCLCLYLWENNSQIRMHAATANTAAEQAPTSMQQMETLPLDVLQSLIQRREADAATALTPRVVEASKHRFTIVCVCDLGRECAFSRRVIFLDSNTKRHNSGRVLKNPLAPSVRYTALAHAKEAAGYACMCARVFACVRGKCVYPHARTPYTHMH